MDGGVGLGIEGVLDPQVLYRLLVHGVVPVGDLLRGDALLVRGDCDGGAVLVGTSDDPDLVAQEPVVAGEDVRWEKRARDVSQMDGSVRIGPCDVYKDFRHMFRGNDAFSL